MIQNNENMNNKRLWRIFMLNISLIIIIFLSGIFMGFVIRTNRIINDQILTVARSHFKNIVLTRRWNADYGGVFVEKKHGIISNPYLENPDIITMDGKVYTQKNPALMTREISEYASREGDFTYHITSLRPLNPDNVPDDFETAALQMFDAGRRETFSTRTTGLKTVFRYMAPLMVEKGCLTCHEKQGYVMGDVRGGISVTFDITDIKKDMLFNKILVAVLSVITGVALISIVIGLIARLSRKLTTAYQTIEQMAITDELTRIYNRRYFHIRLDQEVSRSKRYRHPISLVMLDIDYFKMVNDRYGHQVGDGVLTRVAAIVKEATRKADVVSRYGGEEITVILPETNNENAVLCAEKIRAAIEKEDFEQMPGHFFKVTVSLGISWREKVTGDEKKEAIQLIKAADDALYDAKKSGRNKVVINQKELTA